MSKIMTLKDYKKKYRNTKKLLSYTKADVERFQKTATDKSIEPNFLLKGRKWVLIGDTYYQIPKTLSFTWFRNLKVSVQVATWTILAGSVATAVGLPVYYNYFYYEKVSEGIDDILPTDKKEKALIKENLEFSNTLVKLGKDFETTVSVKSDRIGDFKIENSTEIYVIKDSIKTKLEKDVDYKFTNNGDKAKILVYGKAVVGKLEIDVVIKEVTFNRIVKFENVELPYDGSSHEFNYSIYEGKELPVGSNVTYTYDGNEQSEPFSFSEIGTYDVTLKIVHEDYQTYNSTKRMKITKAPLPQEEKDKFKIIHNGCPEGKGFFIPPEIEYAPGSIPCTPSNFEYYYPDKQKWDEKIPTTYGNYQVRAILTFEHYEDYQLLGNCVLTSNRSKVVFTLSDGETWGKGGGSKSKTSGEVIRDKGIAFKTYKEKAGVTEDNTPVKVGHVFSHWEDDDGNTYTDSTPMENVGDKILHAVFGLNKNDLIINYFAKSPTTCEVEYGTNLSQFLSSYDDSREDAAFKGWGLKSDDDEVLTGSETMPATDCNVYSKWYKYEFEFISIKHCTVSGTTKYDSRVKLSKDDISELKVTTDEGFEFNNKYNVYDGDDLITTIDFTDEGSCLKPGALTKPLKKDCKLILKPIIVGDTETIVFNKNNGVISADGNPIDSLDIEAGQIIADALNENNVVASRDGYKFNNWNIKLVNENERELALDDEMPTETVTLKPVWKTYTVNVSCDNGIASVSKLENKSEVYTDDFTVSPDDGYVLDHYEYSLDGTNYEEATMPFKPGAVAADDQNTVWLKAVCVVEPETYQIFVSAGEGEFADHTKQKVVEFSLTESKTFAEVLAITGKPTKDGIVVSEWKDENGNIITEDKTLSSNMLIIATAFVEE